MFNRRTRTNKIQQYHQQRDPAVNNHSLYRIVDPSALCCKTKGGLCIYVCSITWFFRHSSWFFSLVVVMGNKSFWFDQRLVGGFRVMSHLAHWDARFHIIGLPGILLGIPCVLERLVQYQRHFLRKRVYCCAIQVLLAPCRVRKEFVDNFIWFGVVMVVGNDD